MMTEQAIQGNETKPARSRRSNRKLNTGAIGTGPSKLPGLKSPKKVTITRKRARPEDSKLVKTPYSHTAASVAVVSSGAPFRAQGLLLLLVLMLPIVTAAWHATDLHELFVSILPNMTGLIMAWCVAGLLFLSGTMSLLRASLYFGKTGSSHGFIMSGLVCLGLPYTSFFWLGALLS